MTLLLALKYMKNNILLASLCRTVSTLHALLVGLFCLCILFFDEAVNQDPVWWALGPLDRPIMNAGQTLHRLCNIVYRNQYRNVILSSPCSIFSRLFLFHYRGDPTLVKINVSITTGYLISGETYGNLLLSGCCSVAFLEATENLDSQNLHRCHVSKGNLHFMKSSN